MTGILQEFRFGLRILISRPAFSIAIVLTLAIGIGANTAIFSVINGLLLKPLPYTDGDRLVQVYNSYPNMGLEYAGTSIPDYLDRREQAAALEDLAMYTWQSFNLGLNGNPERLVGLRATPSLFSTLREPPFLGRVLNEDDAVLGQEKVAVLSFSTWKNQFGADREIIGRDIRLNGDLYQVVGVMREGFAFPNHDIQIWVPFAFTERQMTDDERGNEFSASIGRLKPGATVAQLNDQLQAIVLANADRLSSTGEENASGYANFLRNNFLGRSRPLRDQWVGDERNVLWLLQAVVIFVLLIACANVANLMLTRMTARKKELSVRTALGAGHFRIVRQLFIEALLVCFIGAVAGLLLANWSLEFLELLGLNRSRLSSQIGIDGSVLAFSMLLTVFTAMFFGLFPALAQFNDRTFEVLKDGSRSTTGGKGAQVIRSTLVVVQILLAVTLMIGAGLLVKSFYRVQEEDPGFKREGLVTVRLDLSGNKYQELADYTNFYERALEELKGIAGVSNVGYASNLPFTGHNWTSSFRLEGKERIPGEPGPHGYARSVDENYFKTMGIPLLEGRVFRPSDTREVPNVIVVDELFANKHYPNESAVGKRMIRGNSEDPDAKYEIVGVVGTTKINKLSDEVTKETYYFTFRQFVIDTGYFIIESNLPPASIVNSVREAILRVDPDQPLYDVKAIDERIAISLEGRRAPMLLLALFSGVALLLSVIGVYGVLAFSVAQRTSELGVRMALGADVQEVFRLILKQGARLVVAGVGGGILAALALTRVMRSLLFGVDTFDLAVFAAVSLLLATIAIFACLVPARRATKIQPIEALRYE